MNLKTPNDGHQNQTGYAVIRLIPLRNGSKRMGPWQFSN